MIWLMGRREQKLKSFTKGSYKGDPLKLYLANANSHSGNQMLRKTFLLNYSVPKANSEGKEGPSKSLAWSSNRRTRDTRTSHSDSIPSLSIMPFSNVFSISDQRMKTLRKLCMATGWCPR